MEGCTVVEVEPLAFAAVKVLKSSAPVIGNQEDLKLTQKL